jgi:imidazolonepropionase-like amidohydrolase
MGRGELLGQVKTGYLADLLLVDGDPTRDVRVLQDHDKLSVIMKDGKFHKRATHVRAAVSRGEGLAVADS